MSDPSLPAPETCLHNLHRAADRERDPPEATDVCRNELGAFHMLDCPLFLGRRCAWYEEATKPHPPTTDAEIAAAREEMRRDFLGWSYRQRVRNLAKPKDLLPRRIVLEPTPALPEDAEQPLVLKVPIPMEPPATAAGVPAEVLGAAPDAASGTSPATPVGDAVSAAVPEAVAPIESAVTAPATSSENYPGQRRSEDRSKRKKLRKPPVPQFPAAAGAPPDVRPAGDDDAGDDGFGAGVEGGEPEIEIQAVVPAGPKTVEEFLAILPEAKLPEGPPRQGDRGRQGQRGPGGQRGQDGQRGQGRPGGQRGPGGPDRNRGPGGRPGEPRGPGRGQQQRGPQGGGRQQGGGPRPPRQGPPQQQQTGNAPGSAPQGSPQRDAPPDGGPPREGAPRHGRNRRRGRRHGGPPREGGGPPPPPSSPTPA